MSISKDDQTKIEALHRHIKKIFFEPEGLISYDELIIGRKVNGRKIVALESNTYRGFHKIEKESSGACKVFTDFFLNNRGRILKTLKAVKDINGIDELLGQISEEIRKELTANIKNHQLTSFNKVRKPVDIVIEMVVCLTSEITNDDRSRLVPMLRLPLDSWMFKDEVVFCEADLKTLSIKRSFSFRSITEKEHYFVLQNYLIERCRKIGNDVYPICLDLFWNNRFKRSGNNIAELN
jgi:hypothetical protein